MGLIWKPNGTLDVATAASDLPGSMGERGEASTALARCKNLRVDRRGILVTRDGSAKVNTTAIDTAFWLLHMKGGSRYAFAGTSIYLDESVIASDLTSAQWSAMAYQQFNDTTEQVYATNGTDLVRIEGSTQYQWGITAPAAAPTVAVGTGTGLTGTYQAMVTYAKLVGTTVVSESDPSPASASQALTNEALQVTWAASSDSQVTHVRVYRTIAGGSAFLHDRNVAIGTTTVDTTTADASLGTEVATDHDRPPAGTVVLVPEYGGTAFMIKDSRLYYSLPKQPEYWPATYFIEVSPADYPGKTAVFHNGQLHYLTAEEIYYIQGTGHGTFQPVPLSARTGAQGIFGAVSVAGEGIYHTGPDGVYLFTNGTDRKITQSAFEPIFRGETTNGIPGVASMDSTILHYYNGQLYVAYPASGDTWPRHLLVFNRDNERVTYYDYGVNLRTFATDRTNNRLLVGDTSGFVREIEKASASDDAGTAIAWEAQSKDFTLQTRAHFPRWCKYDVNAASADSVTGTVLLDGRTLQTHTLTGNRDTKRRLIDSDNGERCALRLSGSGAVEIYAVESE